MRNGRGKLDIPYLAIFSGILIIAVIASLLLFPEWRESPETMIVLLVAAIGGVVGLAANFRSAFIRDKDSTLPAVLDYDSPRHRRTQENITADVRMAYINGVLRESLAESVRIELALDSPVGALRGPRVLVEGRELRYPLSSSDDIATIFKNSGRALLILGAPGSGKTITLLELCEPLLLRAEADLREPVPIVLNLSTWAQQQLALEEWIIDEMWRQYKLDKNITPVWLAADHLCLLLDGLDEVRADARDACVRAINAFRESHGSALVVCSRSVDYANLSEQLALSRAVEIQPLTTAQIEAYLGDNRLGLAAVREAIARDDALRELSTTPLMLNIIALAYGGRPFAELLPLLDGETERRTHVYDAYITRMFQRKSLVGVNINLDQTLRWLRFLAQQLTMKNETLFFIESVNRNWLPRRQLKWYAVLNRVLFGLICGVLIGGLVGMQFGQVLNGAAGIILCGILGGVGALIFLWDLSSIIFGCTYGIFFGIMVDFLVGPFYRGLAEVQFALIIGIFFGFLFALTFITNISIHEIRGSFRGETGWKHVGENLLYGLLGTMIVGIVCGLLIGLFIVGQFDKLFMGLPTTLIGFLISAAFGIVFSLLVGGLASVLVNGLVWGFPLILFVFYEIVNGFKKTLGLSSIRKPIKEALEIFIPLASIIGLVVALGGMIGGVLSGALISTLSGIMYGENSDIVSLIGASVLLGVIVGGQGGFFISLFYGASNEVETRITIPMLLNLNRLFPYRIAPFMEAMREYIFVQRVRGPYLFIHRTFQEHVAALTDERIDTLISSIAVSQGSKNTH